ncbi:uncharacterized protein [Battus philenor]|uniref:uncharacterized protein n=1 Tax=Battus philenor TaxID=42288 RepID=UPI0035CEBBDF
MYSEVMWWRFLVVMNVVGVVRNQFAVYGPPMPVMMQAVAVAVPQARSAATTTTTTTSTARSVAVALPMPVPMPLPMPIQFPMPYPPPPTCQAILPRPPGCPPCPPCLCSPSCTPAFFSYCSSCHQKCRCRNSNDAPKPYPLNPPVIPMYPAAMPAPSPLVVVPFPPPPIPSGAKPKPSKYTSDDSSCSTDDSSTDDSSSSTDYFYKRARKRKKSHRKRKRHSARRNSPSKDEIVKPVLTYLSRSGDVKYKTKISNDEAERLLGERRTNRERPETVHVVTKEDSYGPQVVVMSHGSRASNRGDRSREIALADGTVERTLKHGKKEIVFRPPKHKRISNLSVSFQVSE